MLKFVKGRPLSLQERALFSPYFAQIVIDEARIIDGKVPFWLRRNMCAVVLGHTIYFRAGAYQPNTKRGAELLGHELTHVSQFLHGMTLLKYGWSCRNGYYKSAYEIEAYAKGQLIAANFATN
ncbi:MAG: hypothetical protein CTY10_03675 [Methylotenera sp.]|nr:MAG: hypothetical protein CTY10_03675 [Methylotenera sp.]